MGYNLWWLFWQERCTSNMCYARIRQKRVFFFINACIQLFYKFYKKSSKNYYALPLYQSLIVIELIIVKTERTSNKKWTIQIRSQCWLQDTERRKKIRKINNKAKQNKRPTKQNKTKQNQSKKKNKNKT